MLVNELGKIDIDSGLLDNKKSNAGLGICTDELTNGCICCSVKDDLQKAVMNVLERSDTVDYLVRPLPVAALVVGRLGALSFMINRVIETSGAVDHQPSTSPP